jgi:hypothetical protein
MNVDTNMKNILINHKITQILFKCMRGHTDKEFFYYATHRKNYPYLMDYELTVTQKEKKRKRKTSSKILKSTSKPITEYLVQVNNLAARIVLLLI